MVKNMTNIRKISNVVSLGKGKSVSGPRSSTSTTSPFAMKAPDGLKALTERKSQLNELQRLAILQRALEPYAARARKHLPSDVQKIEKKVRSRMIKEGFSEEIATEAGDEAVSTILISKRSKG